MATTKTTPISRRDLAIRYADGSMSFRDLQNHGIFRYTELLALLAELNLHPPMARDVGPNLDTRKQGIARLTKILSTQP